MHLRGELKRNICGKELLKKHYKRISQSWKIQNLRKECLLSTHPDAT